jgi:hypothetical protein
MKRKFNFLRFFVISIFGTIGIVMIFHINTIDQLTYRDFIGVFTVFVVFGIKDFRKYLEYKKSVNEGIASMGNGSPWGIDNLVVTCNPHKTNQVIVRNDLFWTERQDNLSTDDLMKCLIADFEKIASHSKLKVYLENKTVEFNLYASDLKEDQLLKTTQINYPPR